MIRRVRHLPAVIRLRNEAYQYATLRLRDKGYQYPTFRCRTDRQRCRTLRWRSMAMGQDAERKGLQHSNLFCRSPIRAMWSSTAGASSSPGSGIIGSDPVAEQSLLVAHIAVAEQRLTLDDIAVAELAARRAHWQKCSFEAIKDTDTVKQ